MSTVNLIADGNVTHAQDANNQPVRVSSGPNVASFSPNEIGQSERKMRDSIRRYFLAFALAVLANFPILAFSQTVPGAPTITAAPIGNGKLLVTFAAPTSNGGSPITSYTATCGSQSATGPSSPITVLGLTNDVAVTCAVSATNAVGQGPFSPAASAVPSIQPPSAPSIISAVGGNGKVTVAFSASTDDGGSPIATYQAQCGGVSINGTSSPITVAGLPNGSTFACWVIAINGINAASPRSATLFATAAATVSDPPTLQSAVPGDGKVKLTFTYPTYNGGSAITGATATCGTASASNATGLPITITGLTNGTAVSCTVVALNYVGASAPSSAIIVTPTLMAPSAPTIGTATSGNLQAAVSFTAPSDPGSTAITSYIATSSPGNITATCVAPCSSITVPGLTNGTLYTFTVQAINSIGTSASSGASNGVTPAQTVPGAPTINNFPRGNGKVPVSFLPPASDGGSPITSYTATCGSQSATGPSSPITVLGLTNGTWVTCTVFATNAIGQGPLSLPASAYPSPQAPSAPTIISAVGGNGKVTVAFSPSTDDGGSPIAVYQAKCGGFTTNGTTSPITVVGPANGTTVACTVIAVNGINAPSPPSATLYATPAATVADPPVLQSAVPGDGKVKLTYAYPAYNGGSIVTSFTATCGTISANSNSAAPLTITGLSNGVAVNCSVVAVNAAGASAPSAVITVTPAPIVPSAPGIGTATPGNLKATVTFTASSDPGSAAITSYIATSNPGNITATCTAPCTSIKVLGLTNGTSYTFTVQATSAAGNSAPSAASNSVTPTLTVPGAPSFAPGYVPGNGKVTHAFTPPADDGGSPITSYTLTCGSQSATGPTSPLTVVGLTNGVSVTCTVFATNAIGQGAVSAPNGGLPRAQQPDPPTINAVTPGNTQATVLFSPPANDGGSPITSYFVRCGGFNATGPSSPITVTGLTNGTPVTCTVAASNSLGYGFASAGVNVTPTPPTVPGAPRNVTAVAGNGSAVVTFLAPTSDGGSSPLLYQVTSNPTGGTDTNTMTGGLSHVITGLTNGTTYSFTVQARNGVGPGPASAPSNSVMPLTTRILYYVHSDHLGTPRAITKATDNTKVWEWSNDEPFGNSTPNEDPNSTGTNFKYNLRFPGQYFDVETGTNYNRFRDYDPATGRYEQSDPIGLKGGANTFGYVGGAPLSHFDEFGLQQAQPSPAPGSPSPSRFPGFAANDPTYGSSSPSPGSLASRCMRLLPLLDFLGTSTEPGKCSTLIKPTSCYTSCEELILGIRVQMGIVQERIDALLADKLNQFEKAFWVADPASPSPTTWVGHLQAADAAQNRLSNLIQKAMADGCAVPAEAIMLATRPLPRAPRGWTPGGK